MVKIHHPAVGAVFLVYDLNTVVTLLLMSRALPKTDRYED